MRTHTGLVTLAPCICQQDWTLPRFSPSTFNTALLWVLPQSPPNEAASQGHPSVSLCFFLLGWGGSTRPSGSSEADPAKKGMGLESRTCVGTRAYMKGEVGQLDSWHGAPYTDPPAS